MIKTSLKNRQERIQLLYTFYLFNQSWDDLSKTTEKLKPSELEAVKQTLEKREELEKEILKYLKVGWSWERLGVLERAILLNGAAEILLFENKKSIVISESNKIAKLFTGEDKAVRLITAILDKVKM